VVEAMVTAVPRLVDLRTNDGLNVTPLMLATMDSQLDIVRLLPFPFHFFPPLPFSSPFPLSSRLSFLSTKSSHEVW